MNLQSIKHLSTALKNNQIIKTVVTCGDRIFTDEGPNNTWVEHTTHIHQEVLEPIDVIEQKEFDVPALKRAYIQGIISSQDYHATNPYEPSKDEFKVWLEGRAFALTL